MCNRYTLAAPAKLVGASIAGGIADGFFASVRPQFNICPSDQVPVLAKDPAGGWHTSMMRWGFIPFYAQPGKSTATPLNAKAETVLSKPIFRSAAQHRRCLLPADGFYEWHHITDATKIPHYFFFKDRSPFYFAGIYENAAEPGILSCALLTTEPLASVVPFHPRSPLILTEEQANVWTRPGPMSAEVLCSIIEVTRWGAELAHHEVSREVGRTGSGTTPRTDSPACIAPAKRAPDLFTL